MTVRILPESPEVDLHRLRQDIRDALGDILKKLEPHPIGFGLTALVATVLVDDATGGAERIEALLATLPGVSIAETTDMTLV